MTTEILIYIIKASVSLAVLYIPFTLLMRNETFYGFNRFCLLGTVLLAFVMPAIEISIPVETDKIPHSATYIVKHTTPSFTPTSTLNGEGSNADAAFENRCDIALHDILFLIYITGVIISLLVKTIDMTKIISAIKRGTLWTDNSNGAKIYCHAEETAPYSWFNRIVISEKDYNECGREILLHEQGHIRKQHSWDMLFLNIAQAWQWFNPFIYMLTDDIKRIHEYEADRYVIEQTGNIRSYQLLIISKAIGNKPYPMANSFNHSDISKRILMLSHAKSNLRRTARALYFVPCITAVTILFARPEYVYSEQATKEDGNQTTSLAMVQKQIPQPSSESTTATDAEKTIRPVTKQIEGNKPINKTDIHKTNHATNCNDIAQTSINDTVTSVETTNSIEKENIYIIADREFIVKNITHIENITSDINGDTITSRRRISVEF